MKPAANGAFLHREHQCKELLTFAEIRVLRGIFAINGIKTPSYSNTWPESEEAGNSNLSNPALNGEIKPKNPKNDSKLENSQPKVRKFESDAILQSESPFAEDRDSSEI